MGTPVPIQTEGEFMFEDTILAELGEYGANARNVYDVASVLLGLYESYVDSGADLSDMDTAENVVSPRMRGMLANATFDLLDERCVRALRAHYRAGSPWEVAKQELPELSDENMAAFRKEYMTRKKQARHDKKARLMTERKVGSTTVCEHCGVFVRNVYGRTRFCGSACKQAAYRARKVEG